MLLIVTRALLSLFATLTIAIVPFALASPVGAASTYANVPPGGKYKDCHGYVRHISAANIRVHCIDGVPADLSFVTYPKYVDEPGGRTIQATALKPGTPVHVIFTESLGIRHAYKVYVADPHGHGLYGFKA
jgi:hypothetical protein